MKRGYIRHSPRFPVAAQRKALEAAGVKVIYEETKIEGREVAIHSLRAGSILVVDGLHRLGVSRSDMLDALEQIDARGAHVMDARTGRVIHPVDVALVIEAIQTLAGDFRSHADAVRWGKKGGKAPSESFLTDAEAKAIWHDTSVKREDCLRLVGLSWRTCYRRFGPRGLPAGRPPKVEKPKVIKSEQSGESGFIYFIQSGNGDVKIGFAKNVKSRMKELQTGHHKRLKVMAVFRGLRSREKEMHARFDACRTTGEWFKITPKLRDFINMLPDIEYS